MAEGIEVGELHILAPGQEEAKVFPVYTAENVARQGVVGRVLGRLLGN